MTRFLDVRLSPVGGELAASVAIHQGTSLADYQTMSLDQLLADIHGRNVLIATHGFNVNRDAGIQHLSNWERLLPLNSSWVFIGLLWPGDSIWAHGLDYPEEPKIANDAGALIAPFLNTTFTQIASLSFASHSLGARVVLATIAGLNLPVRRATLMAAAIDDNCLVTEFQTAAARIGQVHVLASKKDTVLADLYPIGNLLGGIIAAGHPWWHSALGRGGPAQPWPSNFQPPFQIPDAFDFNHANYLQIDAPPPAPIAVPVPWPWPPAPLPANGVPGWQEGFTAAVVVTFSS